jgi:hypothetical protein
MLGSVRASLRYPLVCCRRPLTSQLMALESPLPLARQMRQRATYRLLVAYSVGVAITCSLWLVVATHWGHANTFGGVLLGAAGGSDALVRSFTNDVLSVLTGGISVVGGAMLISGPVPRRPYELIVELMQRFVPPAERRLRVHPIAGGLLLARAGAILPVCLGVTGLFVEHQLTHGWEILMLCLRLAAAVVLVLGAVGTAATWLSGKHWRHPVVLWLAIWLVPEVAHLAHPGFPTPYQLSKSFLTALAYLRLPA